MIFAKRVKKDLEQAIEIKLEEIVKKEIKVPTVIHKWDGLFGVLQEFASIADVTAGGIEN